MACSSGTMTDFWIVSALAPGYEARTMTVGGAMSGYCCDGQRRKADDTGDYDYD